MERFVRQQNLERFRQLLGRVTDEQQIHQIKRLMAEEEAKDETPKIGPPAE